MSTRIYDLEEEVIKEILKVDKAMRQMLEIMRARPLQFDPLWTRYLESCRESIGAYGGLLVKLREWED